MDAPSAEARIAMMKKNITPPAVPSTNSESDDNDDDVRDPDYVPPSQHGLSVNVTCEILHFSDEIFAAACQSCLRVFGYEYFIETCTFCSSRNITLPTTAETNRPAEEYEVEGEAIGNRSAARWMNQSRRNQGIW